MKPPAPPTGQRRRRIAFFFDDYVDTAARVLEIGPGDGWLGAYLVHSGFLGYRRIDRAPPADIVGDVRSWRELGLAAESFDIVIAFDVLQRLDCLTEAYDLLAPGGYLFVVAPVPGRERWARWLGALGLRRRPPAPPTRRVGFEDLRCFREVGRRIGLLEQWWKLRKPL